jgi:hypothetical protein
MNRILASIPASFTSFSITLFIANLLLVIGLLVANTTAKADGTPDGTTPANEGVCDVLKGGTPGLYGLCVAYCEAQDLDSFDKDPPNTKILANYRKKMQAGDPDMPCVQVPCPCWNSAELGSITADNTAAACPSATGKLQIIDNSPKTHFAEANENAGQERCRYIDLNLSTPIIRSEAITADEAQTCYAEVVQACTAVGLYP